MASSSASYAQAVYMIFEISSDSFIYSIFKISTVDDEASSSSSSSYSSSSSSPPRISYSIQSPVVRLSEKEYPYHMGFFSVGSKIFMIGGVWDKTPARSDMAPKSCNDVYIYDTTTSLVEKSQSCMLVGKYYPPFGGAPILHHNDGKVYVFNSNLCCHGFESFDPQLQSWSLLPAPPVPAPAAVAPDEYGIHVPTAAVAGFKLPPAEFDIVAHAIVDHTILVAIRRGDVFFFHSITHIWSQLSHDHIHLKVGRSGSNYVPFIDRAVYAAAADGGGGAWFARADDLHGNEFKYFLYSFRFDDGDGFMGSRVQNLVPPARPMTKGFLTHVVHLGNQRFCVVYSGHDWSDSDEIRRYVTLTVFRPQPVAVAEAEAEAPPGGIFSAIDQHSLSYLLNDDTPGFILSGIRACFPV